LYGDISERITQLLTKVTPRIEVYSVDESFMDLSQLSLSDRTSWSHNLRQRIWREIGIPVSIGIASSKTLAKLGADRAKKVSSLNGVLDLLAATPDLRSNYLQQTPISDVWGVGRRLAPKLQAEGAHTALDLSRLRSRLANQLMGVHGRQLVAELNGTSCHPLEPFVKVRQSVMHGRLFGTETQQFSVIEAAIASLGARAAFRLRAEGLLARSAVVYLSTDRHKPGYQHISRIITFATPTADTGRITTQLTQALQANFNPQLWYHRADVLLYDLVGERAVQIDLFDDTDLHALQTAHARMRALDALNNRYGKGTVRYAAEELSRTWEPKHNLRSPRYTTQWQELPVAHLTPS
jgi:DNA polymerase V